MSMFGKRNRDQDNEMYLDIPDLPPNTSYFGKGLTIEGIITGEDDVHIDGKIDGRIDTGSEVKMTSSATLNGEIRAKAISNSGVIKGDITALNKLNLEPTAKVNGNIKTPSVSVKEGAIFDGEMDMGS